MSHQQGALPGPSKRAPLTSTVGAPPACSWKDPVLGAILVLAAFLLFSSLGDRCLWQDEAETVLLAQGILRTGLPSARHGDNVVSQTRCEEFDADFVWRWSPWIQNYIAAASTGLFGPTAFAARLPFAMLGLACVALTYLLSRRLFAPVAIARLSALLLVLSVPFLLHARQARWQAPAYVLVVLLVLFLQRLVARQRFGMAGFVVAGILLFHTNYFVALGVLAAVGLAACLCFPSRDLLGRLSVAYLLLALLALPGAVYFDILGKPQELSSLHVWLLFELYAGYFATYLVPLPVFAILLGMLMKRGALFSLLPGWKRNVCLLLTVSVLYPLYLSLGPWGIFRYLSVLLPVAAILTAVFVYWVFRLSLKVGIVTLLLLVATDVVHRVPLGYLKAPGTMFNDQSASFGAVRFMIYGYLYEITHHVEDPEWGVVQSLRKYAGPRDVVMATYGDLPLELYTGLHVVGGLQGQPLPLDPDWIFLRRFYCSREDRKVLVFISEHIDLRRYQEVWVPGGDCKFSNNPDPTHHLFRMPKNAQSILLFHKQDTGSVQAQARSR
jgi:hypothetical protein